MPACVNLDHIAVVLHQPRYPENIGSTARAMRNMGLKQLLVVDPVDYDLEKVLKLATHVAADIIAGVELHSSLQAAVDPYGYVVGTTARLGGERQTVCRPRQIAQHLVAVSQENRVALVFGPEDKGLSNEDIRFCHTLVNIPTAEFSSLNLAQAVMIICYEIFLASLESPPPFVPRMATRHELDGMYAQLREILVRICFLNPQNPDFWMNRLRQFGTRMQLRAKEVSILRGVCRQINWYGQKCYQDGVRAGIENANLKDDGKV